MKSVLFTLLLIVSARAGAEDDADFTGGPESGSSSFAPAEVDRDPAALVIQPRKRNYRGGAFEEDLQVQSALPKAEIKADARSLQRDVYKAVYNQELKEERHDDAEE